MEQIAGIAAAVGLDPVAVVGCLTDDAHVAVAVTAADAVAAVAKSHPQLQHTPFQDPRPRPYQHQLQYRDIRPPQGQVPMEQAYTPVLLPRHRPSPCPFPFP